MTKCKQCGSFAINQHLYGREPGIDTDLCDVCYWRKRATQDAEAQPAQAVPEVKPAMIEPTSDMIDAGAQRLVRFEDGAVWPDSFDPLDVMAARNEAERVWRSMALAQPAAPAAPAGWKLVPDQPSDEMLSQGVNAQVSAFYAADDGSTVDDARWRMTRACYAAMLAAAPEVKG